MKKLVFGALIAAVVSQAAGCIISSDDTSNDAFINVNWSLKSVATGTTQACPAGFDTTALYSQPVDANGNNAGAVVIDLFNCDANAGQSAPLIPGLYDSHIAITDHNNTAQYATSVTASVDITSVDKTFTAAILTDGGYFQVAWNLVRASNGGPLLCADVAGISGVEAIATDVNTPTNSASDIYPCEDHVGISGGFLAATYGISVDALNGQMQAIGTAPTITNKVIQSPNRVTDLGTVTIPITAL
jgi:hypothetical protein